MSNQTDYTGKAPIYQKWDEKAFQFDTQHMHWMARNFYRVLLQNAFHLHTRPDLPDDDEQLCRIACGGDKKVWAKHGPAVRAMFTRDPDRKILWQKRLRQDWHILAAYRQKQKEHAEAQHAKHASDHRESAEQSRAQKSKEEKSTAGATGYPPASQGLAASKSEVSDIRISEPSSSSSFSSFGPFGSALAEIRLSDSVRASDIVRAQSSSAKTAPEDCSLPLSDSRSLSGDGENQNQPQPNQNQPQPQTQNHGQGKPLAGARSGQEETSVAGASTTSGADLLRELQKTAADVLKNTCVMPLDIRHDLEDKCELMILAHGGAGTVLADFAAWCREHLDAKPAYPISEYAKVVDIRLGGAPETDDKAVAARAYELTRYMPTDKSVATLLLDFSQEEILGALAEFESLSENNGEDVAEAMKTFWTKGGASTIILARRQKEKEAEEEYCREERERYRSVL